jgi:hypothetical protein
MFAIAAIEHYCEAFPEKATALEWLLEPRRRHTLLSELGRLGRPSTGEGGELRWRGGDVSLLIQAALEIAELRPSTKEGVAMLRERRRLGKRLPKRRTGAAHVDLGSER